MVKTLHYLMSDQKNDILPVIMARTLSTSIDHITDCHVNTLGNERLHRENESKLKRGKEEREKKEVNKKELQIRA